MAAKQHKIELDAQMRTVLGGKVKALRRSGYMPAVLYGKGQEALSLQVPVKDFSQALKEAGESTLVYLNIDGKSYPTIIHDVAKDPVKDAVIHADFYKVNLSEKIKTKIPVEFTGESSAVKDLGGIFVRNINDLEVEALPQNLPHEIILDISVLRKIGDQILVKDVDLGKDVKIEAESDAVLALVQPPKSQEEIEAELTKPLKGVEDVEVIKKKEEEKDAEEEISEEKTA